MASIVLIANGICFAVMTVMFVALRSAADYGSFGRWLLLVLTVIGWVFQYCMMAIRRPDQWPAAIVFYIIAYIAYVSLIFALGYRIAVLFSTIMSLTDQTRVLLLFSTPLFPRLARYMPHVRKEREEDLKEGKIDQAEYDRIESLE